jgi:photosystem II stability/assembly factor-like uncharacterized protein
LLRLTWLGFGRETYVKTRRACTGPVFRHEFVTWCYAGALVLVHRNLRTLALLACIAGFALCPRTVRANGAFPAVSQLLADPTDPAHLVLRSNFGLLVTHDRGANWDLVCEAGLGYKDIEPAIALLADGTTIAALPNGIAHGATECAFGLARGVSAYVADVARVPDTPGQAVAVSVEIDSGVSQVWRTLDTGRSWQPWGAALSELNAATLDIAGDDAGTLYVSGVSQTDTVEGVLARSLDGGQTWTRWDVPGVNKLSAPYIAAIAADDADTLYVRLSGSPGRLLVTRDGGAHWSAILDFAGPIDGFALSPDGRYALASGRVDGVWRASTSELAFERISCTKLRCLSWTHAGLFACADEFQAGFLVGESLDAGFTFEPKLHMSCVRGPLSCASESPVAQACDASWPALSEVLGKDCANAGFTPKGDCSDSGAADAGATAGAGAGGGGAKSNLRPAAGCSLSGPGRARGVGLVALATLMCAMARRRASSSRHRR